MRVFLTEHPFFVSPLVLPKVIGHGWGEAFLPLEINMMDRQKNYPNWVVTTEVFTVETGELVVAYDTAQVWDGTKEGHRRLWATMVELTEEHRDRTGLYYRLWKPTAIKGKKWEAEESEVFEAL